MPLMIVRLMKHHADYAAIVKSEEEIVAAADAGPAIIRRSFCASLTRWRLRLAGVRCRPDHAAGSLPICRWPM